MTVSEIFERWQKPSHIQLHAGEMTAQELRSVIAVVKAVQAELTAALSDQVVVPNPAAQFVMWALLNGSWQGDDIDGGAAQDKAVELGLIVETTYDPTIHGESDYCDPGDSWYVPSEKLLAMLPAPASTSGEVGK